MENKSVPKECYDLANDKILFFEYMDSILYISVHKRASIVNMG